MTFRPFIRGAVRQNSTAWAAVLQEERRTRTLRKISASSTRSMRVGSFSVQKPVVVTARPWLLMPTAG